MKKLIFSLAIGFLLIGSGCNIENAEDAAKGYLTETLTDFKKELPDNIKMLNSMLLDSLLLKKKIAETTNLDSLEKYNDLLKDAKNLIRKDLSTLDSINPGIRQIIF